MREVGDALVLLPLSGELGDPSDDIFVLAGSARTVWEALDRPSSIDELSRRIAEVVRLPVETVQSDVEAFVGQLVEVGAVTRVMRAKALRRRASRKE